MQSPEVAQHEPCAPLPRPNIVQPPPSVVMSQRVLLAFVVPDGLIQISRLPVELLAHVAHACWKTRPCAEPATKTFSLHANSRLRNWRARDLAADEAQGCALAQTRLLIDADTLHNAFVYFVGYLVGTPVCRQLLE